jgi:hypothetical protein
MNTSVVVPIDFDKDGDWDLFVGSRSLPKTYGLSPVSYIFENLGNLKFKDSTPKSFQTLGLIRDAAWEDINGDNNKELIVVGDWMNPMTFTYQNGAFTEVKTGLENYQGFWGRIEAVDIDNDKDLDLVLGNIGDNFMLRASENRPVKIWVSDFDNNGLIDKILTKTVDGEDSPVLLKREMMEQFPILKKENLKHSAYATKRLKDLFTSEVLSKATIKQVNYMHSAVAINDGKGNFRLSVLPVEAQISCINATYCVDINNDGLKDILLGGNNYNFIPQFSRLDAFKGKVLLNKGKGVFVAVSDHLSGFAPQGEMTQLKPVKINGTPYMISLLNNALPQLFKIGQPKPTL